MHGLGNKSILAKNLRRLMQEKDVSAKEMSKKLKYPYTTILSWMNAENYPRIDKIEIMAKYFGVQKSDLIEEEKQEEEKQEEEKQEGPANNDGLSENKRMIIDFVEKSVPEDKAEMILRVMQSIVESGR